MALTEAPAIFSLAGVPALPTTVACPRDGARQIYHAGLLFARSAKLSCMENLTSLISIDSTAQAAFFWASFIGIAFSGLIAWQQGGNEWDWIYLQDWLVAAIAAWPLSAGAIDPTLEIPKALTYGFLAGAMLKGGSSGFRKSTQGRKTAEKQLMSAARRVFRASGEAFMKSKIDEVLGDAR